MRTRRMIIKEYNDMVVLRLYNIDWFCFHYRVGDMRRPFREFNHFHYELRQAINENR